MFEEEVYISKEHIIRYNLSRTVGDACPYDSCLVPTIFLFFPFRNLGRRDVVPYGLCLCKTRDKMITISQPHVAQFATYHDGFAVYITASHCDAYITCDAVALYHAPKVHIILHFALALRASPLQFNPQ